jgi:dimethylargininase
MGIEQLRAIVEPAGWAVTTMPVTKVLHLKTAITALPDGTFVGRAANIDDDSAFGGLVDVPEDLGASVIALGDGAVLMSAAAPRTVDLLRERGIDVIAVSITEFEKLQGGVTCMSVRIRHAPCLRDVRA